MGNKNKVRKVITTFFDGTKIQAGLYFYKLTSGSFEKTNKMVLLK